MLKRVIVALCLLAMLIAVLYFGGIAVAVAIALCAVISVHEMTALISTKGFSPCVWPLYGLAALLAPAVLLFGAAGAVALWMLALVCLASDRVLSPKRNTEDTVYSSFVLVYPLPLYVILLLAGTQGDISFSRSVLLMCFAGPLAGDTMALFCGMALGRRKLAPNISPNKTVAGGIGGLFGGVLGGLIVWLAQQLWSGSLPLVKLLICGLVCGALGQIGDLFASSIKRWAGVKDYGRLLPGHGGVMDRLDSVLMCAPAVYAVFYMIGV